MLVLTRKVEQGLVIAGDIHVKILGIDGNRVKVGIAAPKEIPILRDELLERHHPFCGLTPCHESESAPA